VVGQTLKISPALTEIGRAHKQENNQPSAPLSTSYPPGSRFEVDKAPFVPGVDPVLFPDFVGAF
jgi:hypothetical protein